MRVAGEDVVEGQLILTAGHVLRPYDLGALLAAGLTRVWVRRRPRVAIIPTGDELVEAGADLKPGDLVEFNSSVLSAFIAEWGGEALTGPILEDRFEDHRVCGSRRARKRGHRSGERGLIRRA